MTFRRRDILFAILAILLTWQILSVLVNKPILPSPVAVSGIFIEELSKGLLEHFLVSLWRVVASTALAIIIAVPIGLLLGQSKKLNSLFSPLIYLLYPIPKVVFVPIVLLFFGLGDFPKI